MRYIKIFFVILAISFLQGCVFNNPEYINLTSKPTKNYYSIILLKKLNNKESFKLKVFDRNLYKYYSVDEKDNDIVLSFLESLTNDSYKDSLDVFGKSKYQLIIEFSDSKYIINSYDEKNATLFPWDGNYIEDKIDMSATSKYNNIYDFCKYIIDKN